MSTMPRHCVRLWGSKNELDTGWPLRSSQSQGAELQNTPFLEFPNFPLHTFSRLSFLSLPYFSRGCSAFPIPKFYLQTSPSQTLQDQVFYFCSSLWTPGTEFLYAMSLMILQGFNHQGITPQEKEKRKYPQVLIRLV